MIGAVPGRSPRRPGLTSRLLAVVACVALAGCAALSEPPSPAFAPEAECWRNGGVWHAGMRFCEYNFSAVPTPAERALALTAGATAARPPHARALRAGS